MKPSAQRNALVLYISILALGLATAACGGTDEPPPPTPTASDQTRGFAMGISSLPPELTEESYIETFGLAGSAGEVILIQRTPPWAELLAGHISEDTVQATQREVELAEENGLELFIAIDPTDGSKRRSRLAGLPDELIGAGFANEDIRHAFITYAEYIAESYQPKYLALGIEINSYQQHQPEDFERFVILYHETYEAVKAISPDTLIFPTFQLEELQGLLPLEEPLRSQWHLISRFEPRLDLLAVSSFPGLVFPTADEIPDAYFSQISLYSERPIAITGLGYSSAPAEDATRAEAEAAQAAFVRRTLNNAEQIGIALVVWFAGQDPTFTGEAPLDLLRDAGLIRQDGTAKPAWTIWTQTARRPLEE